MTRPNSRLPFVCPPLEQPSQSRPVHVLIIASAAAVRATIAQQPARRRWRVHRDQQLS